MQVAPLKRRERALEKASNDYDDRDPGPAVSWLFDIVRGKAVCETGDQILAVWNHLQACKADGLEIARVKNRCAKPNFNGYRDFLLNLKLPILGGADGRSIVSWHMCELQIHIKQITDAEKRLNSHTTYEYFRTYFFGNMDAMGKRLNLVLKLGNMEATSLSEMVDRVLADGASDARTLDDVAALCKMMDQAAFVEKLRRAILDKVAVEHGKASSTFAVALSNLAELLRSQNRLAEAEPLYVESLARRKAKYGDSHRSVADGLNNLGALYQEQGKLAEAEAEYRKALAMRETVLGAGHKDVANSHYNLAQLLRKLCRHGDAGPHFKTAIASWTEALGEGHEHVLRAKGNLAATLGDGAMALGPSTARGGAMLGEAVGLHRQVLVGTKKQFGKRHREVARACAHLASSLSRAARATRDTAKAAEAEALYAEALAIDEEAFGDEHPEVANDLDEIARLQCLRVETVDAAETKFERSLAIRRKCYGDGHPAVATSYHHMAKLAKARGRHDDAEALFARSLEIRRAVRAAQRRYDRDNEVGTVKSLSNMAELKAAQGRRREGAPFYREVLEPVEIVQNTFVQIERAALHS